MVATASHSKKQNLSAIGSMAVAINKPFQLILPTDLFNFSKSNATMWNFTTKSIYDLSSPRSNIVPWRIFLGSNLCITNSHTLFRFNYASIKLAKTF